VVGVSAPSNPASPSPDGRSLAGRVAFVTGAARGIGRAIALALAAAGADIAVADAHPAPFTGERYYRLRRRVSGPDEETPTGEAVAALGRRSVTIGLDVADAAGVEAAVATCTEALGPPDVLVNNAGIVNNIAPIAEMASEAWQHELQVNLTGMFHTVRAIAPGMAARGWGRVVNISSIAALSPGLAQPAYAASKAGVIAFTKAVAQEFGPGGVTANAILPGLIATPLVRSMPAHLREQHVARTPVGRLGEPEDIGALAAFLASPAAGFISAVAIPCDGGVTGAARGGLVTRPPDAS
jgi:NAD(P)-dependent dehydrogenase (short-subunit alcohol dehydrogenase family)